MEGKLKIELSSSSKREINKWLNKFPDGAKQSAILPALTIVQKENKSNLTKELIIAVAEYLDVASSVVYEAATFYKMYELQPIGKYKIAVCTNVSCMLCNAYNIAAYLKEKLAISFDETTKDGKFYLQEVECIGACDGAPAMLINDKLYSDLTLDKIDTILSKLE